MVGSPEARSVALAISKGNHHRVERPPDGLAGAEAEEYVERKLNDIAPMAVYVLNRALLNDENSGQQMEAARQVLDRAGFMKKERQGQSQAPVVILIGDQATRPPWLKPRAQVIDVQTGGDDAKDSA